MSLAYLASEPNILEYYTRAQARDRVAPPRTQEIIVMRAYFPMERNETQRNATLLRFFGVVHGGTCGFSKSAVIFRPRKVARLNCQACHQWVVFA